MDCVCAMKVYKNTMKRKHFSALVAMRWEISRKVSEEVGSGTTKLETEFRSESEETDAGASGSILGPLGAEVGDLDSADDTDWVATPVKRCCKKKTNPSE